MSLVLLNACEDEDGLPNFNIEEIEGLSPIYESDLEIEKQEASEIVNPGRIISYGNILLVNDSNRGVHVVDNSDPSNPQKLFFIDIPFNTDMSVRNDLLYVDNGPDLVVLRVSQDSLEVVSRIESVFFDQVEIQEYPPEQNVYYQCPDESKGRVIGWKRALIAEPDCYKS